MYINTFKYTPKDVSCQLCTEYVKKLGCTALRCPWLAERIEAGVVGYREAVLETFPHERRLFQRLNLLIKHYPGSLWSNEQHERRMQYQCAVQGYRRRRDTNAYYAAMYLLTSNDDIYRRTANCFCKDGIEFGYRVWSKEGAGRSAESHYPTMSIDDIRNLSVRELADKNCILFMWVTFPTLREAFPVIDAWGFTYKTVAFAWIKQNKKTSSLFWGMGYWTRANVELCLLATKGSPKRHSANVHQVVFAPIAEHSKSPILSGRKLWSWQAICLVSSYLPDSLPLAGMYGATK